MDGLRRAGGEGGTDDNDERPSVRNEAVREELHSHGRGLGGAVDNEWRSASD